MFNQLQDTPVSYVVGDIVINNGAPLIYNGNDWNTIQPQLISETDELKERVRILEEKLELLINQLAPEIGV